MAAMSGSSSPQPSGTPPPAARTGGTPRRAPTDDGPEGFLSRGSGDGALAVIAAAAVGLLLLKPHLVGLLDDHEAVAAWLTVFVSVNLQALPFLVLGVLLSSVIAVLVPPDALARWLPHRPAAAVPVAGLCGVLLPGCECASVPIAGSLVRRGMRPAIALTFLLSAPAINPVVLVSTAVAFNGRLDVVAARFSASLLTAVVVGWLWLRTGRDTLIRMPRRPQSGGGRLETFIAQARHDLLHSGGFLVVGGAVAATVNVVLPQEWLQGVAGSLVLSIAVLAVFAVVVAICSEADAFVAASLTQFPLTARLAFMVVGPVLDVKLFSMQVGTFGRAFATRFAPLTFVVAVTCATVVGLVAL
jgi:uncharacterized membrane protein YraQ (UPF0718 family)